MTQQLTVRTIEEAETMAKDGAAKLLEGSNLLSIALYNIVEGRLYQQIVDEKGKRVYNSWQEYEPHLLEMLNISRATMYNHLGPARLAFGPTFQLSIEEYLDTGGKDLWSVVKQEVEYNNRTGEVLAIPGNPDVDIKEYIMESLKEVAFTPGSDLNLTMGDAKQQLHFLLGGEEKPNIAWSIMVNKRGGYDTIYSYTENGTEVRGCINDPNPRAYALEEYCKKLRIDIK